MDFEDIKLYLPKYLSPASEKSLFDELKNFPENIDGRLYSEKIRKENVFFQGDGIEELPVTNLPSVEIRPVESMIFSNTCDMSLENKRIIERRICYSPIMKLVKLRNKLIETNVASIERIEQFIDDIKRQRITQILFLPCGSGLNEDAFVVFDRISSCGLNYLVEEKKNEKKLFSLSNYGLYLFLFKLSIHFTRINEGKDRDEVLEAM